LAIEGDHLGAGLGPCCVTVVIQLRERWRGGHGEALPEPFNCFMIQAIAGFIIDNPASFITSEKYITVSWGKPQSFDTAPCVAVLLPDFGSTGRLPGSDRF
jgi:hypothetical protein